MPRIEPIDPERATPEERANLDQIVGRVTNMKRTLSHSAPALRALMEWYPLHDAVTPFLGERLTSLFCHAISSQNDCLICSTYFRRELIEAGENPDDFTVDAREQTVIDFGRQIATNPNAVDDELYSRLASYLTPQQIVTLTAFGALMIATNVFNNALNIPLDEELERYRLTPTAVGAAHA